MEIAAPDVPFVPAELRAMNHVLATLCLSSDGRILRANQRFQRLLGHDVEDLVGRNEEEALGHEAESGRAAVDWPALRAGRAQSLTLARRRRDGDPVWLQAHYVPLRRPDGAVGEVVALFLDVSEDWRQAEAERGQAEALDGAQAVLRLAFDGTILDANARFQSMLGFSREALVGRPHASLAAPDDAAAEAALWSALRVGEAQSGEFRRIGAGGRSVWLKTSYCPVRDENGQLRSVVAIASDATEDRLRRAEAESQLAAVRASHAVVTFDMHGTILSANGAFLAATGYGIDEIRGRHHRLFVEPSLAHGADYAAFWRQLGEGRHQSGLYRRIGRNGREIWFQASYNPIFDMAGRPAKVVKYATDVTQERRIQVEHQGQIAAIHASHCVVSFALDGTILDANENFLQATGYRFADLRGRHHRLLVPTAEAEGADYARFWHELGLGRHQAGTYRRLGQDGREIWLQASYNPILDASGRPLKIVTYATDVTADRLLQADARGQVEAIGRSQAVMTLALDGTILEVNDNLLAALGYARDELEGHHHRLLVEPDDASSEAYGDFWRRLGTGAFHAGLYRRIGRDGREVWLQATYNPVLGPGGRPLKVIKFATDVTANVALAAAFADAKRQARHDAVTALPTRRRLDAFLGTVLAVPGARLALLYIDLHGFTALNEARGHAVGDRVLGVVADRLRRALTSDQIAARVGHDEFVVAAPGLGEADAEAFAARFLDLVGQPMHDETGPLSVQAAIGVAVAPADGTTPDDLLRAGDVALHRAKAEGSGRVGYAAAALNERLSARRVLAADMRRALGTDAFFLEFQPRFDTQSRGVRSVEALVRWNHPERGRIGPGDFIPLAEETGLIVPLGRQVLDEACRVAASLPGLDVSVNVSPVQFRDASLIASIADALDRTGLPAGRLEIEITEGALIEDGERARTVLHAIKSLGVRLAMDDFGTGYSSLGYLRDYPFDVLKIDRRFVADLGRGGGGRAIVQAILSLGAALGLSVTAEGVETNEQLLILSNDRCREVQGFLLARPMAEEALRTFLRQASRGRERPASRLIEDICA